MKRRLTIARALINDPRILLLDEPTTGLDPQARHILWDRLFRLKEQGTTLVLTTHYMDEAEQLCDRLVVVDKGRIMAEGAPGRAHPRALEPRGARGALRLGPQRRPPPVSCRASATGSRCCRTASSSTPPTARRPSSRSCGRGLEPITSLVRRSSLEDVFLRLTGRSLVE